MAGENGQKMHKSRGIRKTENVPSGKDPHTAGLTAKNYFIAGGLKNPGGGRSLVRTVLCRIFPANREKYREFCEF